jgi:hypothetical protein
MVRLWTRNAVDFTNHMPAIASAASRLAANSFTIDGEAVVLGADGVSQFDQLRRRAGWSASTRRSLGITLIADLSGCLPHAPRRGCDKSHGQAMISTYRWLTAHAAPALRGRGGATTAGPVGT